MGHIAIVGRRATVRQARLELYHLESSEADWNLELLLDGDLPRLLLSGTVVTPVLPGPSQLCVCYVDDPVDLDDGCLTSHDEGSFAELRGGDGVAHIQGRVRLTWNALAWGTAESSRDLELELDVEAAIALI